MTTVTTYEKLTGTEALTHAVEDGAALHQWAHVTTTGATEPDRVVTADEARALLATEPDLVWCLRPAGTIDDAAPLRRSLGLPGSVTRFVSGYWRLEACVDRPVSAADVDPMGDSDSIEELDAAVAKANAARVLEWADLSSWATEAAALAEGRARIAEAAEEYAVAAPGVATVGDDGLSIAVGDAIERVRALFVDDILAVRVPA